jgi:glucose/arabinose dehydrogenase
MRIAMTAGAAALMLHASAAPAVEVGLELVADGLTQPLALVSPPADGRRFIVEQTGRIRILMADGRLLAEPFLDVSERLVDLEPDLDERGLLGLAFHPRFADNGRFYVHYSAPLRPDAARPDWNHTSHISEFRVALGTPNRADPKSERVLLRIDQPLRFHNGGTLAFGPDGHLYIALGDGGDRYVFGEGEVPEGNAQATDRLLGKILRIDVSGHPYLIPDDNPFVGQHRYRPEIWALGLRNPYRCTFDAGGEVGLICGDVGEAAYEEIDVIHAGGNYGWPIREGRSCFWPHGMTETPASCRSEGLIEPVAELGNCSFTEPCHGRAIIGGYLYRGTALPALSGRYVFGDWSAVMDDLGPSLYVATPSGNGTPWPFEPLEVAGPDFHNLVLGFGEDAKRELYVLGSTAVAPRGREGRVYKIVPPADVPPPVGEVAAAEHAAPAAGKAVTVVP